MVIQILEGLAVCKVGLGTRQPPTLSPGQSVFKMATDPSRKSERYCTRWRWLLAFFLSCMFFLLFYFSQRLNVNFFPKGQRNSNSRPRVVLIYTRFFGSYPWEGLEDTQKFIQFKGKACHVQNCVVSYKKEDFSSSDAVIFHARDLPSVKELRELHNKRPPNQAWVFFLLESPAHSPDTTQYDGLFNWTMTYRRDSDVYHPYGFYAPLEAGDEKQKAPTDCSLGKDKLVVWTVSNCAGKRFSYVDKLKPFVKVDIFGGCGVTLVLSGEESSVKIAPSFCDLTSSSSLLKTQNALIT